jgi:hypothetical protein
MVQLIQKKCEKFRRIPKEKIMENQLPMKKEIMPLCL